MLVDSSEHFERWATARSKDSRDPLSAKSAVAYRYVWLAWITFLSQVDNQGRPGHGVAWSDVSLLLVERFLETGVSPSSGRKSRSEPISKGTRKRYLDLLDWLYESAKNAGLVAVNPLRTDPRTLTPIGDIQGQVFNTLQWTAIHTQLPQGESRWELRDRAALLLLLDQALTTGEICAMKMSDVSIQHVPAMLKIDGKRGAQERTLQLESSTSTALTKWLEARSEVIGKVAAGTPVFVTQKGSHMSPRPLFHLVAKTVSAAFASNGMGIPNHIGPAVLRNTKIVMWLNEGVPVAEVLRRAGYKDFRSFRCLRQHVRKGVLPTAP